MYLINGHFQVLLFLFLKNLIGRNYVFSLIEFHFLKGKDHKEFQQEKGRSIRLFWFFDWSPSMNIRDRKSFEEQQDKIVFHRVKFIILLVFQVAPFVIINSTHFSIFYDTSYSIVNIHQNQVLLLLLIVNFVSLSAYLIYTWNFSIINSQSSSSST